MDIENCEKRSRDLTDDARGQYFEHSWLQKCVAHTGYIRWKHKMMHIFTTTCTLWVAKVLLFIFGVVIHYADTSMCFLEDII